MRFQKADVSLGTTFAPTFSNLKILVKINRKHLIPKLALVSAAVCSVMLAFTPNANAITNLTFDDQYGVGIISPGAPASPAAVATYVNYLITFGLGESGIFSNQNITRSNNEFANLPDADANIIAQGTSTTINLGASGVYTYLFAKYDGQNDNSQVWYVGNLSGTITIPSHGPRNKGLSGGYSLAQALQGFPMAAPQ